MDRTGAGTERIADMDLPGMTIYLDWFNVMTYDFHGGWESTTGHNAPLYKNDTETASDIAPSFIKSKYNCDAAIQAYLAAGVPSNKILMGLPLYGRGWKGLLMNFSFQK
jgi:chitinase